MLERSHPLCVVMWTSLRVLIDCTYSANGVALHSEQATCQRLELAKEECASFQRAAQVEAHQHR